MNTELQNKAWSVLPKEFKEEVKEEYFACKHCSAEASAMELEIIFGEHNLTSDAEGEEMLTCDRDVVRMLYDRADSVKVRQTLESLFGSKCLPDEVAHEDNFASKEPQPAEPKFKEGDRAIYCIPEKQRIKARVVNVRQRSGSTLFNTLFNYDIRLDDGRTANWVDEQWLLPDNDDQVRAVTEKASEQFDKILAKDLRKEKRLRIAAQITASIYANHKAASRFHFIEALVRKALEIADTLIAECEKGGNQD